MDSFRRLFLVFAVGLAALFFSAVITLVLLRTFDLAHVFRIPNAAMAPTLIAGDNVYMDGFAYWEREPQRGEIICFRGTGLERLTQGSWYIKRVVGLPGETISLRDGVLMVGNAPAPELARFHYETFYGSSFLSDLNPTFTVPKGTYFVLGDNPKHSLDSRFFGPVPQQNIGGRVVLCFWPPRRWRRL